METKKEQENCLLCNWKDSHGNYKKNVIIRWVLGIIILVAIFSFGLKLGEFKQTLRQGLMQGYYGYGGCPMMQGYYGNGGSYGSGMGPWMMLRGLDWQSSTSNGK